MTEPRTLEEIAAGWLARHGQCQVSFIHWAVEDSQHEVDSLVAALREAADGEREKCIEIIRLEAANWPEIGAAILFKVQGLLRQR